MDTRIINKASDRAFVRQIGRHDARLTAASSVMSQTIMARPPAPVAGAREADDTRTALASSSTAIAGPIPFEAPVTMICPSCILKLRFALFFEGRHALLGIARCGRRASRDLPRAQPLVERQVRGPLHGAAREFKNRQAVAGEAAGEGRARVRSDHPRSQPVDEPDALGLVSLHRRPVRIISSARRLADHAGADVACRHSRGSGRA